MNALPQHITVSIALSSKFSVEAIKELYLGIEMACREFNIDIIGGDTTSSNLGLILSITICGRAALPKITKRNTAKIGDVICVSGDLGAAYLGLQLLEREKKIFIDNPNIQPTFDDKTYLIQRFLKPTARIDIIHLFANLNIIPNSMIDISDGLSSELLHITRQSNVGCLIYEENLPIAEMTFYTAIEMGMDPNMCAMNGGEDYELLFTLSEKAYMEIQDEERISMIGRVVGKDNIFVTKKNNRYPITAQGWKHLS